MKIDPIIFISEPFTLCPKCSNNTFGVLNIFENHYTRKCKKCLYPLVPPYGNDKHAIYKLPKLNKKVIYIDQFAISDMMKALNPETKFSQKIIDDFWIDLFNKLYNLSRLQLIICPESTFHQYESVLSPFYDSLKNIYRLLSSGLSFNDVDQIKSSQLYEHARNWVIGMEEEKLTLDIKSIVNGNINGWQRKFIISGNFPIEQRWIDELRGLRNEITEELTKVFQRWQTEKDKSFEYWFEEEATAFGNIILKLYFNKIINFLKIGIGVMDFNIDEFFPTSSQIIINSIHDAFLSKGIDKSDLWPKTIEYLKSRSLVNIPFNKINAMLWAALARKAATGQKRPPNKGMANDILLISLLLPYCNAMFIDNQCRGLLTERPLCEAVDYGTRIFSQNNKDEFLEYLDEIESGASQDHLDKVMEVYGKKGWKDSYKKVF